MFGQKPTLSVFRSNDGRYGTKNGQTTLSVTCTAEQLMAEPNCQDPEYVGGRDRLRNSNDSSLKCREYIIRYTSSENASYILY